MELLDTTICWPGNSQLSVVRSTLASKIVVFIRVWSVEENAERRRAVEHTLMKHWLLTTDH